MHGWWNAGVFVRNDILWQTARDRFLACALYTLPTSFLFSENKDDRNQPVSQSEHATKTDKELERNTNKRVHSTIKSLQTQSRKARLGSRETQRAGVHQKAIQAQPNSQAISPKKFGWIWDQPRQCQGYSRLPTSIKWVLVGGVGKAWHSSGCVCCLVLPEWNAMMDLLLLFFLLVFLLCFFSQIPASRS